MKRMQRVSNKKIPTPALSPSPAPVRQCTVCSSGDDLHAVKPWPGAEEKVWVCAPCERRVREFVYVAGDTGVTLVMVKTRDGTLIILDEQFAFDVLVNARRPGAWDGQSSQARSIFPSPPTASLSTPRQLALL